MLRLRLAAAKTCAPSRAGCTWRSLFQSSITIVSTGVRAQERLIGVGVNSAEGRGSIEPPLPTQCEENQEERVRAGHIERLPHDRSDSSCSGVESPSEAIAGRKMRADQNSASAGTAW